MLGHDAYGKRVLRNACDLAGDSVAWTGSRREICDGVTCDIDAVLESGIAVEIESRVNKQIRGALLDLILHPCQNKLMILIPAHMGDVSRSARMCEAIVERLAPGARFACVTLRGTAGRESMEEDARIVAEAIRGLTVGLSKVSQLGEQN